MDPGPAAPSGGGAASCCADPDPGSALPCSVCQKTTCQKCRKVFNGQRMCAGCFEQAEAERRMQEAVGPNLPLALAAGLIAALLSGAVWAVIAVLANVEVGYVALGVGWLAGIGVVLGGGGKKAAVLQFMAVGCAILGLLLGKYFTLAHAVKEFAGKAVAEFDAARENAEQDDQARAEAKTSADAKAAAQPKSGSAAKTTASKSRPVATIAAEDGEAASEELDPVELEKIRNELLAMRDMSYFSPRMISFACQHMSAVFGLFDLLWLLIALGIAWKVPSPRT